MEKTTTHTAYMTSSNLFKQNNCIIFLALDFIKNELFVVCETAT